MDHVIVGLTNSTKPGEPRDILKQISMVLPSMTNAQLIEPNITSFRGEFGHPRVYKDKMQSGSTIHCYHGQVPQLCNIPGMAKIASNLVKQALSKSKL